MTFFIDRRNDNGSDFDRILDFFFYFYLISFPSIRGLGIHCCNRRLHECEDERTAAKESIVAIEILIYRF